MIELCNSAHRTFLLEHHRSALSQWKVEILKDAIESRG